MRDREALTRREVNVPIGLVLVWRSDLDGRFLEVSPDLARLSGYDAEALSGEYDDVLVHPDVPRAVIQDMRGDLGAERPWCGILKFRCRNGDHYWARVDIAPIRERGQGIGFVSILRRAMRHQVEQAEEAYRLLRERRADGLAILHGSVAATGPIPRALRRYGDIPARFKLMAGTLLAALSGMVLGNVTVRLAGGSFDGPGGAGALGAVGLLGLSLGVGICVATIVDTNRRLRDAQRIVEALGAGEYLSHVECVRDDEAGRLQQDLKILQTRLASDLMDREGSDSAGAVRGRRAASAAVCSAVSVMKADAAALVAQTERQMAALDQALERAHSARDALGRDEGRKDTAGATHAQSGEACEGAVARLADIVDHVRGVLSCGDDAADRLELLAFRTKLLAFNAALEQMRHTDGTSTTALLAEGRDVVRGVSESATSIRKLLAEATGGAESGTAFLREIEAQIGALVKGRGERSVEASEEGGDSPTAAGLLDRVVPELQQIGAALHKSVEVSGRLLGKLLELEQAANSLDHQSAVPDDADGLRSSERIAQAPLRSRRRTATISPLRPARHEVGAPVPKIGRAGTSKVAPDDGWEEFQE
jgi:aerotaxis receptor